MVLLEFENWAMIPIENIISAFTNSGTKVAALYQDGFLKHKEPVLHWNWALMLWLLRPIKNWLKHARLSNPLD